MTEAITNSSTNRLHDAFFRWLFAVVTRLRYLLELAGKANKELADFLSVVNLDTLTRIPDSYSNVDETGEADLAYRVNVSTGAPVLVGILLEHKSGRDPDVLNQIARYVNSVMKIHGENRVFDGLPTMAIIFYNGRENWNPLKTFEDGFPEFFRGKVLPFQCAFINMIDIPDSDCLVCEDVETGMGIVAMKYAYNEKKLLKVLPQFKDQLKKIPPERASCLLQKISVYLGEYVNQDVLKELDMAFVSVGQKYGFVSAGDVFRQKLAEAEKNGEEKAAKARSEGHADAIDVFASLGVSPEKIAEAKAKLDAISNK